MAEDEGERGACFELLKEAWRRVPAGRGSRNERSALAETITGLS